MRAFGLLFATAFLVALMPVPSARAQEAPGPGAEQKAAKLPVPDNAGALPDDLHDRAFERYVDLRKLGEAIEQSDASLATDVALQLAEGERILLRSHKAISAKDALQLALKLAAEKRDNASLQRLGDHARRTGDEALARQMAQAQKLAAAKRAIDPLLQLSVETTTVEQFAFVQRVLRDLESARFTHNGKALASIIEEIKNAPEELLSQSLKAGLGKRAESLRAELVESSGSPAGDHQLATVLAKLHEGSRTATSLTATAGTTRLQTAARAQENLRTSRSNFSASITEAARIFGQILAAGERIGFQWSVPYQEAYIEQVNGFSPYEPWSRDMLRAKQHCDWFRIPLTFERKEKAGRYKWLMKCGPKSGVNYYPPQLARRLTWYGTWEWDLDAIQWLGADRSWGAGKDRRLETQPAGDSFYIRVAHSTYDPVNHRWSSSIWMPR